MNRIPSRIIEAISRNALKDYDEWFLNSSERVTPLEEIADKLFGLEIEYCYITNNGRILGKTIFDSGSTSLYDNDNKKYMLTSVTAGTILIDATLLDTKQEGRYRFTLAHEISHYILHKNLYRGTGTAVAMLKDQSVNSEEKEANMLASYLLIPKGKLKRAFHMVMSKTNNSQRIIELLSKEFNVSKECMKFRLKDSNMI